MTDEHWFELVTTNGRSLADWFIIGGSPSCRSNIALCEGILIEDDAAAADFLAFLRRHSVREFQTNEEALQAGFVNPKYWLDP
jgi:hypothetical protein